MTEPAFGCPFHGLVKGGSLTLPDASAMDYPQPTSSEVGTGGITQRVQGAGATLPIRTPEQAAADTVKNYQWLDYAIVSGENGQLCGQALGDTWHLYTDPAGVTWKMTAEMYVLSLQVRIRIRLTNVYGRLPKRWEDVDREILSADFSLPNGESDQTEYWTAPAYLRAPERNSDGSVLLFHLYWGEVNSGWSDPELSGFPYRQQLRAVYKVTLSGSGNYENAQLPLGEGISVVSVLYKDLDDIETDLSYDNSYPVEFPELSCHVADCSDTQNRTWHDQHIINNYLVRLVFDSSDTEVEISYQSEEHQVTSTLDVIVTDCGTAACNADLISVSSVTYKFNLLRDDTVIAESGDYVRTHTDTDSYYNCGANGLDCDRDTTTGSVVTWRGSTLRDTDQPWTLDELPGDHADGVNIFRSIAFISPQVIGVLVKQAVRNGPGNFTLKRVHVGPAVAAEADSADIDVLDPTDWQLKVYGSYEPGEKAIARATDEKLCYV